MSSALFHIAPNALHDTFGGAMRELLPVNQWRHDHTRVTFWKRVAFQLLVPPASVLRVE